MVLRDGEQIIGSGSVAGSEGELVLGAAVNTPSGRQVHLAVPVNTEDKTAWRGGDAPPQGTVVDEDGEEYTVDTWADATVVLDAADAARVPQVIEDVIARAVEADKQFRQVVRDCERLQTEQARLEGHRYPGRAEEKIRLDERVRQQQVDQRRRRAYELAEQTRAAAAAQMDALIVLSRRPACQRSGRKVAPAAGWS